MSDSHSAPTRSIGSILDALRPEFPDVTISKIRFLEAQRLITPQRTASGYRSFTDADLERLRYILTAQRDRFWPLKVIREALDAIDRGLQPDDSGAGRLPSAPTPPPDPDVPTVAQLRATHPPLRLTRAELSSASGLSGAMIDALCGYGLLQFEADGHFAGSAVPIATAATALASYGIEARHLRPFRTAADREIGLVEQVVAPLARRDPERKDEVTAQVLRHGIALHIALVRAAMDS
ncbi:MAG: MerR family transcriptional regulator [Micrococcales bacterium]|nr:MerR family transcriptional regulator [Micrococcales bacterium]